MAGTHALFSPSSADRISKCPASLLRTKDLPDSPSWEAVEGTIAHAIHEYGLLHPQWGISRFDGMTPQEFMLAVELRSEEWAVIPADWKVPVEMLEYVQRSMDWCLELDGEHYVEQRLSISKYTPIGEQFGTCDHLCVSGRTLYVSDLKYGRGVKVYAERNPQLCLYALGALEEHDWLHAFDRVVIRVSQPRLDHFDVWETTPDELRYIGAYLKQRFTLALEPDAPFGPDEKACQFCKLKPTCPALYQRALELSHGWFENLAEPEITVPNTKPDFPLSTPDPHALTTEQLALVLDNADMIRNFIDAAEAHALYMLLHGRPVPNRKVVEGRSVRKIANVSGYENHLRENGVEPFKPQELIGVSEAEKQLRGPAKKELSAFLIKPPGKPTLAHISDKREPYTLTADQMFGDESSNL